MDVFESVWFVGVAMPWVVWLLSNMNPVTDEELKECKSQPARFYKQHNTQRSVRRGHECLRGGDGSRDNDYQ